MIDVSPQIDEVRRAVGSRTLATGEARVATMTQSYDTTIEDIWDACTNIERIPRWLMPITGDLRVGGTYQLIGNANGTIQRCDRPNSFAATWEYGGQVSWIEVQFSAESPDRTLLTVEHIAHVDDDRWAEFGPGAVGVGWDMMLMGLAGHLSSGESVDPANAMAWIASDEGKKFILLSSERWCAASILAGTEVTEANAARDRTTAAYTGS
jgi:uncharacterized protein YndB with AHSA1/START domain